MALLMTIVGIVLFVIALLLTVGLHELGHLIPAKKFGVKVPKYFIGFGPTLWSMKRGGTEYGIKAIPLGGFVQLAGMLPPAREGTRTVKKDGSGALTLAEEARQQSAAELEPGEEHQALWRLSARKKLVVMFGGPFVNLLLSLLLIIGVMCGIGWGVYGTTLSDVPMCEEEAGCDSLDVLPGYAAGLRPGDVILSWADTSVTTWEEVQAAIADNGTEPAVVQVQRGEEKLSLTVTPREIERPIVRDGAIVTDPQTGEAVTELQPFVGISPSMEMRKQSLGAAFAQTGSMALGTARVVIALPSKLWDTAVTLVTGKERGADSVMSVVGVADVAGTIASADIEGYGFAQRAADFLMLMAALNMSLFVFNLLPLLPLDGGHILGALIEGVRRTGARIKAKVSRKEFVDPGAFDTARLLPLSYAVIAFFVLMTILLVAADVFYPVV